MRRARRVTRAALCVAAALALPPAVGAAPAPAQPEAAKAKAKAPSPEDRARAAEQKALADEAYLARQYRLALQRLEAAWTLDPDPRYIANQGLVYEQLGEYDEAVAALRQFLESDPPADKARAAREVIDRLEPPVRIETTPPGATVTVQGEPTPRGTTPLVTRVTAGTHTFILDLPGHARWRRPAKVEPGEGLRVEAALAPLPAPPPVRASRGLGADGWGYVALGAAAVAGASGAVLYTLGLDAAASRDGAVTGREWDAAHDRVALYDTTTVVAASIAGAALVTGVALIVWGGDDDGSGDGPTGEATVGLGPGGAVLSGRF